MRRVLLVLYTISCARIQFAQETIHHASIGGRLLDPSGGVVPGASVIAKQTDTNVSSYTVSDRDGRFRFPYLKIGPYQLMAAKPGFADSVQTLALRAGSAYEVSILLTVRGGETSVEVTANTAMLDTSRSQVAGSVAQRELTQLPTNGRNFLDLALLIPGVSPTNTGSNQLFAETSAVPGQGISFASQRNFSNTFMVDGLSANDDSAGLTGVLYGLDAIQEMQVVTSGGQAELGRAMGGFVNVVTRSGSNSLHGDLYGYFRNHRGNAANPLSNSKLPMTQAQYGASLGGPLKHDRTFYFTNFEQRQLHQSGLITIAPVNVAAINAQLDAVGYPGPRVTTGIYPNPAHLTTLLGKLDHSFSARDQFTLRYSLYDANSTNSRGAGGLNATSASAGLENTDHAIAFSNILTLSPHTVNETRGQFTDSDLLAPPTDEAGPAISIAGVATFGRLSGSPTGRRNRLYELVDNFSHQTGAHAVRAGILFLYNDTVITFPRTIRGAYAFSSLANFRQGVYNNSGFTQTFGNTMTAQTNPNIGFYLQDEWRVLPSLTLNAGVRYDLQFLETIATDANNLSPRGGFAWTPFASRRTVIRGGFGLFYDRVPLRALANALLSSGNTTTLSAGSQISLSLSPTQAGAPAFPNILSSPTAAGLVNFTTMDRQIQNGYSAQGNVEVEHQLGGRSTLTVGYQHLRGIHLVASINQNVPTCVAAGNNNGCRPISDYGNNSQYRSQADSNYDGLHVSWQARPGRWGSYRVSYAYSKSMNDVGEFFFSAPIDPYNIWQDWGRSDDDQRHRVVFDGVLSLPRGFQLSGMLQYYSTLPMNITTGATTIQGSAGRPVVDGAYIQRNTGNGSDFFNVNLRASHFFAFGERLRMEAMAEGFNALNHRNNLTRNGVFGTGAYPSTPSVTFGQVTAVNDPRSVQLALRFRF